MGPRQTALLDSDEVGKLHEFVLEGLENSKGDWPAVADASGVPYRTLKKIATREIEDPGIAHIQKLVDYFRAQQLA